MDDQPTPLPPGARAPGFTLPRSRYASLSLSDLRGRRVVPAFYPADWEPVSREQLALYQGYAPAFRNLRADLLGVSTDGTWSHAAFAKEAGVRFPLPADPHPKGAAARAYGVYLGRGGSSGRALFVVEEGGTVRWSRACPTPANPGVDGILRAPEAAGHRENRRGNGGDDRKEDGYLAREVHPLCNIGVYKTLVAGREGHPREDRTVAERNTPPRTGPSRT